jgi:hypothetical protein
VAQLSKRFLNATTPIGTINKVLTLADTGRVLVDVGRCNPGEVWQVSVPSDPNPNTKPPGVAYSWAGDFTLTRQQFAPLSGGVPVPGYSGSVTYSLTAHLVFHNQPNRSGLMPSPTESTVAVTGGGTLIPTFGSPTPYVLTPGAPTMTVTSGAFNHNPGFFNFTGQAVPNPSPGDPLGVRAEFEFDSGTSGFTFPGTSSPGADVQMDSFAFQLPRPGGTSQYFVQTGFDPATYIIQGGTRTMTDSRAIWTLTIPTMVPTIP